ncbi:MAG: NADH-quinone oxidoreductase subunit NuoH, partial [Jatrophihabitantaceae bacterium]|nr:NADH-quinone oxidoreductase subunit NuoH [Jatrophihabitantaceae bacterium]
FLGGWRAPAPISTVWAGSNEGWWPILWFTLKIIVFLFAFVWLRGTLPRLRYDQFMHLGWKLLLPLSLVWLVAVAFQRVLADRWDSNVKSTLWVAGPVIVIFLIVVAVHDVTKRNERAARDEDDAADALLGPAFPTPPMDLIVPPSPSLVAAGMTSGSRRGISAGSDFGASDSDSGTTEGSSRNG